MTKLMDELVEIGAAALAADFDARSEAWAFKDDATLILNAVLPVLAQRMLKPAEYLTDAGSEAVSLCYSLEPGEGFDEPPGPAAYLAMVDGFFERELGLTAPDASVPPLP